MSYSLWEQRLTIFWAGVVGSLLGKKCCMCAVRHSYPRILFQSLVNCHLDPLGSTWHLSQEAKGSRDFKSAWAALCRLSRLAQMVKARAHGLHRQDRGWRFGGKPTFITVSIAELCFVFFCSLYALVEKLLLFVHCITGDTRRFFDYSLLARFLP